MLKRIISPAAVLACSLLTGTSAAATVFETTELVAISPSLQAQLPEAVDFEVGAAGSYVVTLHDLKSESLLKTLRAIVTRDQRLVAQLEVIYPSGTPPLPDPAPATDTFEAAPGTYRMHILGVARDGEAGGAFGVSVAPSSAGSTPIYQTSGVVAADSAPGAGQSVLRATFDISSPGTYQLNVVDHAFPAALVSTDILLLRRRPGATPEVVALPGPFTVSTAGTYDLIVFATADAQLAGMYTVRVNSGSAPPVYQSTNAVGEMPPAITVSLPAAGQYDVTAIDKEFPAALTSVAVAVTQNGAFLGSLNAAGSASMTAAQGDAQLFALGRATDVGAFGVRIARGTQVAYADVHTVDGSPDLATSAIYSFAPSQPVAAGSYRLTPKDFGFTGAFAAFNAAIVQGDAIIGRVDQVTALEVALQAGVVKVLVAARPPAASGNGLFALRMTAEPASTPILEGTQGVGGLFRSTTVSIPAAGRYDFTVTDLRFPKPLLESALAITRGTDLVGQIYGGTTLLAQQLPAGTYVLAFLGRPAANEKYGSYGLKVADTPPPPTVTLTANPTSVTSGERVMLQWSTTNATGCTASEGWIGAKPLNGPEQSAALTANTTFNLTCNGPGGSQSASVSVTVNPPSRGGGGGAMDAWLLIYMSASLGLMSCRPRDCGR